MHNEDCRRKQWIICQWLEGQWVNLWTTELLYLRVAASVTGESPFFVLVISPLVHYQNRAVTYQSRGRHSQVTAVSINRPWNSHGLFEMLLKTRVIFANADTLLLVLEKADHTFIINLWDYVTSAEIFFIVVISSREVYRNNKVFARFGL